jgi:dimethylamine monooxygenase subunit A
MAFDFDHAVQSPFRMQPGLRRLAPGTPQLTPNGPGARHLREKLAVLFHWPDEALLQRPGFDAAPALAALAAHAAAEHPHAFGVDSGGTWQARRLGWSVDAEGQLTEQDGGARLPEVGACLSRLPAPWRRAALIALAFAEDFAIVDGRDATLPWLAVCLPSHWAPQDKVGRHFAEVHAPVADNALLLKAGEHLMRLVTQPDRWERFVWNVTHHPRLHTHPARVDPAPWPSDVDGDDLAAQAWFRTERQTFIPVPAEQQAVFTILVDSRPLALAIADPAEAMRLREALASMSQAVLHYRNLAAVHKRLLAWLDRRSTLPSVDA